MAKSLSMLMLVFTVLFIMAHTIFSQKFDRYSLDVPEDVSISPPPCFYIYTETPDKSPFEADPPTMEYNMKLGRQYTDKQFNFLQICLQKLNSDCGDNIVQNMLDKTTTQLTNECCRNLLKIGKKCHLGVAHIISSNTEYNNIVSKAIPKSKHTWKDCVRRVGSHIGSPIFLEELN
ncbi:protein DOWN-REGULATED IN DIF1 11-like [Raphanus sativus]|uniref:Protein DOWN-REGULATED IN DIF1 11-like n=1 Tax=Raphanus sativus TaxID=3726 RepID=A0A6J0LFJ5_RAPSA|nr:protein DOWN-REGULATED IN DIF1 11-like [Raphanus sativus]